MKPKKIHAKIKSDFVYIAEELKAGKLKRDDFFKWLEHKTRIYPKLLILIENEEKEILI